MSRPGTSHPSTAVVWTVLGALCFVWGTTYLGIREVNRTMPPLVGAGARFLIAGAALHSLARPRTHERPTTMQWRGAAIVGGCLVFGGNAGVAWFEYLGTPTGIVALIIAPVPLWLELFDRVLLRVGDERRCPTARHALRCRRNARMGDRLVVRATLRCPELPC